MNTPEKRSWLSIRMALWLAAYGTIIILMILRPRPNERNFREDLSLPLAAIKAQALKSKAEGTTDVIISEKEVALPSAPIEPGISYANYGRIKIGMTLTEVEAILGPLPDQFEYECAVSFSDEEWILHPGFRLMLWVAQDIAIFVCFDVDGQVYKTGEAPIPQRSRRVFDHDSPQDDA